MMELRVEDAIGRILAHDLTKIVPGEFKGAAFRRGHVIRPEDVETLKDMGKYHVHVLEADHNRIHENDGAAMLVKEAAGDGTQVMEAVEGKCIITAKTQGLLKVNTRCMEEFNLIGDAFFFSVKNYSVVKKDQKVAAVKIIPLTISREKAAAGVEIFREYYPAVEVKPFLNLKAGIVITGSEVYYGRIQDKFKDVLEGKIRAFNGELLGVRYAPDDGDMITGIIREFIAAGAQLVLVSGGMAVDSDDVTPMAISEAAPDVVTYGAPVTPGALCMVAYCNNIPVMGVPACAMFSKTTILDILLPRFFAGERVDRIDIARLANGGMCLECEICSYPVCPFGK